MDSGRVEVWVGGLPFQFSVLSLGPEELANIGKVSEKTQSGEIRAIMPGRITSIMVKPGEEVSVGTPLLLLEAMKMQNEIVSPKSGKVTSIKVREGATVKKDAILIEIT
jgi:biotin carboxyl carrier protein